MSTESKRPDFHSEETKEEFLILVREEVRKFLAADEDVAEIDDEYLDDNLSTLWTAIEYNDDGYHIAHDLERDGWEGSTELVEFAENLLWKKYSARDIAVEKWITANGLVPHFKVGDNVTYKFRKDFKDQEKQGEVTRVEEKRGQYIIFDESEGHVRKGNGSHGFYINYEDVR